MPNRLQIPIGPDGQGMGFGTAVVREPAVAEAIVAKYHNSVLEGRPLFLRLDCDTVGCVVRPLISPSPTSYYDGMSGRAPAAI